MFVVVLAAETDGTGRSIAFLIACLLSIAAIMTALTIWYWRFTSPKQVAERMALSLGPARDFQLIDPSDAPPLRIDPNATRSQAPTKIAPKSPLKTPAAPGTRVEPVEVESVEVESVEVESVEVEPLEVEREEESAVAKKKSAKSTVGNDPAHPQRSLVDSSAITEAIRAEEASKPEPAASPPAAVRKSQPKAAPSPADPRVKGGTSNGNSISDDAWERITRSMLDGFQAEKSDT